MNKVLCEAWCVVKRNGDVLKTTDFKGVPALYKTNKAGWCRAVNEYGTKAKALEAGIDVAKVLLVVKSGIDENT